MSDETLRLKENLIKIEFKAAIFFMNELEKKLLENPDHFEVGLGIYMDRYAEAFGKVHNILMQRIRNNYRNEKKSSCKKPRMNDES